MKTCQTRSRAPSRIRAPGRFPMASGFPTPIRLPLPLAGILLLGCAALGCALLGCASPSDEGPPPAVKRRGETPDWVRTGGKSLRFPESRYLTGFAMEVGGTPIEAAKKQAAADLANRISVRIEHELRDVTVEENGTTHYKISAMVRASSDVRLSDLRYETWEIQGRGDQNRAYALAVLDRHGALARRRAQRERAIQDLRACMASAARQEAAGQASAAVETYASCRRTIAVALDHDAVVLAVLPGGEGKTSADRLATEELMAASRAIDERVAAIFRKPAASLRDAVENLAVQLGHQGVSGSAPITVAPLSYGNTDLSSTFGRQASLELEGALVRKARGPGQPAEGRLALRGFYLDQGDEVQISATVREAESGRMLAAAESRLALAAVPAGLALKPSNFNQALADQGTLAQGELLSGDLRVELWTDRGKRRLLYTETEELRIYFRVNQPSWVRLIYVLQNGVQVPIEQGYYVDASKVNRAIEYPESFEVVPPFGVEHIYATAFTEEPPPLVTEQAWIDGQSYDIVAGGMESLVATRGIRRQQKREMAESYVSLTTTPRN